MPRKISVVMTTFNGASYVEKQLLSLWQQSRPAEEVIIQDDVSSDDTAEIVQRFISAYHPRGWSFSVNKKNLGYKQNFFTGISRATGDLVFLCDQDDVWCSDKIERMERVFIENPNIQGLSAGFHLIDSQDYPLPIAESKGKTNNGLIGMACPPDGLLCIPLDMVVYSNISQGCTSAYTKNVCTQFLSVYEGVLPHDWVLNILSIALGGLYFLNSPLIKYRIHEGNAIGLSVDKRTSLVPEGSFSQRLRILNEQKALLRILQSTAFKNIFSKNQLHKTTALACFVSLREKCLIRHHFFAYLRLWTLYHKTWRLSTISPRSLAGDFFFMLFNYKA